MKRRMALIQRVLEYAELNGNGHILETPTVEGYSPVDVEYHIQLCGEAGYLRLTQGQMVRLTWEGHNELDRLRQGESQTGTKT